MASPPKNKEMVPVEHWAKYVGGPLDGQTTSRSTGRWAALVDNDGARLKSREIRLQHDGHYRYAERWDTSFRPSVKIREYIHSTVDSEALAGLQDAA